MTLPEVSVVVPTLDATSEQCLECLRAIRDTLTLPHEVILIDNGGAPQGFTAPVNAGLRATRGQYVVVMNDDVTVLDGWWTPLQAALDTGAAVVFPHTIGFVRYDFAAWCFATTQDTLGTFGASDGEFLDPLMKLWYSDTDLQLRLETAGNPPLYVPGSHIRHRLHASHDAEHPDWSGQIAADHRALLAKHRPDSATGSGGNLKRIVRSAALEIVGEHSRRRRVAARLGLVASNQSLSITEVTLLAQLGRTRRCVVVINVGEGTIVATLCAVLPAASQLHLIDEFGGPLRWPCVGRSERSVRRVVGRALDSRVPGTGDRGSAPSPSEGPTVTWPAASAQAGLDQALPIELLVMGSARDDSACQDYWDMWSPRVVRGGHVMIHNARASQRSGRGNRDMTALVDRIVRSPGAPQGWRLVTEVDGTVVICRE